MKRKIISIDDNKCNGCGLCVPDCPEGALQIIEGKARLVGDLFCDGLGACINTCPQGAITVEEREAEPYDEVKVMNNVVQHGQAVVKAHLKHLFDHGEQGYLETAVGYLKEKGIPVPLYQEISHDHHTGNTCPGSLMRDMRTKTPVSVKAAAPGPSVSQLRQWPVQLKLLNPQAPYFDDSHILLAADCVPFAYAGFHERFLKDKIVITFCPKLDPYTEEYIEKLSAILTLHAIQSISIVRMEVPCCGGMGVILQKAMGKAGKTMMIRESVISINGEIL